MVIIKCYRIQQRKHVHQLNSALSSNVPRIMRVLSSFSLSLSFSLCKGRTLYSVVRDAKVVLDVNKTRQIAQEMVKVK